jgi:uncharacterized protein
MPSINQQPWWRFPLVWMVLGGPAVVVVASFATLYLAITRPDPVVDVQYYQHGLEINKTLNPNKSMLPAMRGRDVANLPAEDVPESK